MTNEAPEKELVASFDGTGESPRAALDFMLFVGLLFAIGLLGSRAWEIHGAPPFLHDGDKFIIGRDFLNSWFYGRAAWAADPGRFYDHAVYAKYLQSIVPGNIADHVWSYPPPFLFLAAPFGLLPYLPALAAWSFCGLALLYLCVREAGYGRRSGAILAAPAVSFCLLYGQVSLFCAALTIMAFKCFDRRPYLAGMLLAILTIKPQIGILLPVFLLGSRRYGVLAAAIVGTLVLALVTVAAYGPGLWLTYVRNGLPAQIADMHETASVLASISPTFLTALTLLGVPAHIEQIAQGILTLAAIGLAFWFGRRYPKLDWRYSATYVLACTVLAAPYLLLHDLVAWSTAAVFLAAAPLSKAGRNLMKLIYILPILQLGFSRWHLPIAVLIPIAVIAWMTRELSRRQPQAADLRTVFNEADAQAIQ